MTMEAKALVAMAKALGASIEDYSSELAFSVDGNLLAAAISNLTRAVEKPIYLNARGNTLVLKTLAEKCLVTKTISDGFKTISAGKCLIPYTAAKKLAKAIDDDGRYTFKVKNDTLTIDDGADKKLTLYLAENAEYLKLLSSEFVDSGNVLTLAKSELKNLLDKTLYAAAKDKSRPLFTAVNFKTDNNTLTLSATNTARLATATTTQHSVQGDFNCNISFDVLKIILPLLKSKGDALISFNPPCNVKISLNNFDINARCVDGIFPDCAKAIPKAAPVIASVDRARMIAAINLCKPFADEHGAISLCFTADAVEVSSEHYEDVKSVKTGGSALVYVQADTVGVGINHASANLKVDYLLGMLKSIGSATVTLELSANAITIREDNSVAVASPIKGSVKLPEQVPVIAPSTSENVTTIDIDAKIKVA